MRKILLLCFAWVIFWPVTGVHGQTWLVVGDSISAAYGIEAKDGWVSLLQQRLEQNGLSYQVVNASISGDTTAGGLSRLPLLLEQHQPQLVIIELGGNDGLRGLPLERMRENLADMVQLSQQQGAQVLLIGMRIPPNYGQRYTEGFYQVFQQVAKQKQVPVLGFFLQGVGDVPHLMQSDGIHPTLEAQTVLLENVWPWLQPFLPDASASRQ